MICEHCGTDLPLDHPVGVGLKIEEQYDWEYWEILDDGASRTVDGLGPVVLVASNVQFREEQGDGNRPAFLIFEVAGKFYRKNGYANSYGEVFWTGEFLDAVKKTVTKEVWE